MAHLHSVHDTDTHFTINAVTRQIRNDSSKKTTLIQYDHNSERFSFDLPRYIDGHDMLLCDRVEVHYINIDSTTQEQRTGLYEVDDLAADPTRADTLTCSWLISQNATGLVGALNFLLRFCCTSGGAVTYAWNTAISSGITISAGLSCAEEVVTEYPDILAQWRAELFEAGGDAVHNVQTAQADAVAAIAEAGANITGACENVRAGLSAALANAVKGSLEGEIVTAADVSPVAHEMAVKVRGNSDPTAVKVRVCGKNLLPYPFHNTTTSINGATYTDNGDGTIALSGTPTDYGSITLYKGEPLAKAGKVTMSGIQNAKNVLMVFNIKDADGNDVTQELTASQTIDLDEYPAAQQWNIGLKRWANGTAISGTVRPMIEVGESATEYEKPRTPANYTPEADGSVPGVMSVSPNMTLLTDAEGMTIECEYNRDTNVVVDKIVKAIEALGGSI